MELPKQKNFYDVRRQFQGKDQPTDAHPAPDSAPPARGQLLFGVILLGVLAALFLMRERSARDELSGDLNGAKPAATQPAAPAKH
jgi:hypothetical protein